MALYTPGAALAQRTMAITLALFLEQNRDAITTIYLAGRDSHCNAHNYRTEFNTLSP